MKIIDGARLWGKTKQQQEDEARSALQDLLQTICRGLQDDAAAMLMQRARMLVVKNRSRTDGQYVFFAGFIPCQKGELPNGTAKRWVPRAQMEDLMNTADPGIVLSASTITRMLPRPRERLRESGERENK